MRMSNERAVVAGLLCDRLVRAEFDAGRLPPGAGPEVASALPKLVPGLTTPDLAATDAMAWPLGDAGAAQPLKKRKARVALDEVVATAFASDRTTAVIVLKDGKIIDQQDIKFALDLMQFMQGPPEAAKKDGDGKSGK